MLLGGLAAIAAIGCGSALPGATFQEGVELIPGPGILLIRVEPPEAVGSREIEVRGDEEDSRMVLFPSQRGADRFLSGVALPSTLTAWVDGLRCDGSIDVFTDVEYDATLRIDADSCFLTVTLTHRPGTVEHRLEEDGPVSS